MAANYTSYNNNNDKIKATPSDIKKLIYVGAGLVILYNLSDWLKQIKDYFTPTPKDPATKEQEQEVERIKTGILPNPVKKGAGKNLIRLNTDAQLIARIALIEDALDDFFVDQDKLRRAFQEGKYITDKDFQRMSELFQNRRTQFTIAGKTLTDVITSEMSTATKRFLNKWYLDSKHYPTFYTTQFI
jgi:hypothetical protein